MFIQVIQGRCGDADRLRRQLDVWEETIAPGGYASRRIARGTRLRLIDLSGDACASMLMFNAM